MQAFTLYVDSQFCSPWAMSAFVALTEKGLPFTLKSIDLEAGEAQQPPFRDLGLTGRVPTLVQGDFVLAESSAIIEYLDDFMPAPDHPALLPADLRQRAKARQVQAWVRSDLMPLRAERPTSVIFQQPVATALSPAAQASADRLIRIAGRLVDGANLFGQWCIADTELALTLMRLHANGDALPERLQKYALAQWQRPSVQAWLAQGK